MEKVRTHHRDFIRDWTQRGGIAGPGRIPRGRHHARSGKVRDPSRAHAELAGVKLSLRQLDVQDERLRSNRASAMWWPNTTGSTCW